MAAQKIKMNIRITICKNLTPKVETALKKLIPQLCPGCEIPTTKYFEEIISDVNSNLFIAEVEEEIIGVLILFINQMLTSKKAWIEDVIVDQDHRNKGVAKQLLNHAISYANQKGVSKIDLTSSPEKIAANHIYQKIGFKKRDTNVYRLEIN